MLVVISALTVVSVIGRYAMGLPITGDGGSLEPLSKLPGRSVYIHMNNTNPILDAGSREAAVVAAAGIEIAADGQELEV